MVKSEDDFEAKLAAARSARRKLVEADVKNAMQKLEEDDYKTRVQKEAQRRIKARRAAVQAMSIKEYRARVKELENMLKATRKLELETYAERDKFKIDNAETLKLYHRTGAIYIKTGRPVYRCNREYDNYTGVLLGDLWYRFNIANTKLNEFNKLANKYKEYYTKAESDLRQLELDRTYPALPSSAL